MKRQSLAAFTLIAAVAVFAGCANEPTSVRSPRVADVPRPSAEMLAQTIEVDDDEFVRKAVYSERWYIEANATSGLPILFVSLTPSICTIGNGNIGTYVDFIEMGECRLRATQAGNDQYWAAPAVNFNADVQRAEQDLFWISDPPYPALVGTTYTLNVVKGDSDNPVVYKSLSPTICTVAGEVVTFVDNGECFVAADQAGNKYYEDAETVVQGMFVGPVAQVIKFTSTPPDPAIALDTYDVSATGGESGNPVAFSSQTTGVCTVTGSTVSLIAGGTCTIAADQKGTASGYLAAEQKKQTFEVSKREQAMFNTPVPKGAKVGSIWVLSPSASSGMPVTVTVTPANVCILDGLTVRFIGVGVCDIKYTAAGTAAYLPLLIHTILSPDAVFEGFASPILNGGAFNVAKAGQTVGLKWRAVDVNGRAITNLTSATVTAADLACALGSTPSKAVESAAGASGLQNLGNGYYQFNWKTPTNYKGSCKEVTLALGDGVPHKVLFQFTK